MTEVGAGERTATLAGTRRAEAPGRRPSPVPPVTFPATLLPRTVSEPLPPRPPSLSLCAPCVPRPRTVRAASCTINLPRAHRVCLFLPVLPRPARRAPAEGPSSAMDGRPHAAASAERDTRQVPARSSHTAAWPRATPLRASPSGPDGVCRSVTRAAPALRPQTAGGAGGRGGPRASQPPRGLERGRWPRPSLHARRRLPTAGVSPGGRWAAGETVAHSVPLTTEGGRGGPGGEGSHTRPRTPADGPERRAVRLGHWCLLSTYYVLGGLAHSRDRAHPQTPRIWWGGGVNDDFRFTLSYKGRRDGSRNRDGSARSRPAAGGRRLGDTVGAAVTQPGARPPSRAERGAHVTPRPRQGVF